jgi:ribosomal protein S18 acetylase RimI-like enzyme
MDPILRKAAEADADAICLLEYLLFPENNFNEKTLANEIAHGASWVVDEAGQLLAYMLCRVDQNDLVDIIRLGVLPKCQGRGLGTRLLQQALSISGDAMLSVRQSNKDAVRLYEKHGFVVTGLMPQHDCWVMQFRRRASSW